MNGDSKCLLFDRRYGWIVDEFKDPSEEALSGGRGMFCVLPIAKSIVKMSSSLVNIGLVHANNILKKYNKSGTGTSESNAERPAWLSEIERLGLNAELNLESSRREISK